MSVVHDPRRHASAEQATRRIAGVLALLLLCPASHSHTPRASPRADGIGFVMVTSTRDPCYSPRSRDCGICQTFNADTHKHFLLSRTRTAAVCDMSLLLAHEIDDSGGRRQPSHYLQNFICVRLDALVRRKSHEHVATPSRLLTIS